MSSLMRHMLSIVLLVAVAVTADGFLTALSRENVRPVKYHGVHPHRVSCGHDVLLLLGDSRGKRITIYFGISQRSLRPIPLFGGRRWGFPVEPASSVVDGTVSVSCVAAGGVLRVVVPSSAKSGFVGVATEGQRDYNNVTVNPANGWLEVKS